MVSACVDGVVGVRRRDHHGAGESAIENADDAGENADGGMENADDGVGSDVLVKASVYVLVVIVVWATVIVLVVVRKKVIDVRGHEVMEIVDVVVMVIDDLVSETESGDDHHPGDQLANETSQMMMSYLMSYSSLNLSLSSN